MYVYVIMDYIKKTVSPLNSKLLIYETFEDAYYKSNEILQSYNKLRTCPDNINLNVNDRIFIFEDHISDEFLWIDKYSL